MPNLTILLAKETRAAETRVALVPQDVQILVEKGYQIFVEHDAGVAAGFSDSAYQQAGAHIRYLDGDDLNAYQQLFTGINFIVRAKRPTRQREILENQAIAPNTILVGGLDPFEKNSTHIEEYHRAKIIGYSIDQLKLSENDPMNVLAAMSRFAGRLALQDAITKSDVTPIKKIVIIGIGIVGKAAVAEAKKQCQSAEIYVVSSNSNLVLTDAKVVHIDAHAQLAQQQEIVKKIVQDADVVVTSARKANQLAPLLIPQTTLQQMKRGAVIVDMALSEGGNVEGSEHDATLRLGNDVIVTNTSGYPKALPQEASVLWSKASLTFILNLLEHQTIDLKPV